MKQLCIKFLHTLSRRVIKKYNPKVIAITGSVGKTAVKEAVYAVVRKKYSARRSRGNFNTDIGLPLTILDIDWQPGRSPIKWIAIFMRAITYIVKKIQYPEVLVLEMGADKPGDIAQLVRIAHPDIGIITTISAAHTEQFKDVASIAHEKGNIFRAVNASGWIVVNRDDPEVVNLAEQNKAKKKSYSMHSKSEADIWASNSTVKDEGTSGAEINGMMCKIHSPDTVIPITLTGILGEHWVYPALAAAAVANILEIHMVDVAEALAALKPQPGRMRILAGIKYTTIIDDTYNSSPSAAKAAVESVGALVLSGRKYAVLGDMLELGAISEAEHKKLGRIVADSGIDVLITTGERARDIARGAKQAGMEQERVFEFDTVPDAGRFIQRRIEQGDVILVKGSRGIKMERVVKEIMAEPEKADALLVH